MTYIAAKQITTLATSDGKYMVNKVEDVINLEEIFCVKLVMDGGNLIGMRL